MTFFPVNAEKVIVLDQRIFKVKVRLEGQKGTGMREQGSLKGEGTHRGNLFAHNSEQNLAEKNSFKFRIKKFL